MQAASDSINSNFHLSHYHDRKLVISGPCSAETEQQVMATAQQLLQTGIVDVFRAGIWKPRTRPGSFEGVGTKGLYWLQQAKAATGLPLAIEVATEQQVEDALRFDIDALWIGARSTANPFSVQALANVLKGVDIPVFIKNPTNPDIALWMGALERLEHAGLKQLALIHRGFSTPYNASYRNAPLWHIAMEMKNRYPQLMMLNDPSHISGRRNGLKEIVEKAYNLNYDGFIIEAHHDPDKAWSDAAQQITPEVLNELLNITQSKPLVQKPCSYSSKEIITQQLHHLKDELQYLKDKSSAMEALLKDAI